MDLAWQSACNDPPRFRLDHVLAFRLPLSFGDNLMASLHKRATPAQAMLLRVVEGSIKNTCDAHQKEFDPYFARSVAKRAAGTLSGCWPEVLAAKPSEKIGVATHAVHVARSARKAQLVMSSDGSKVANGPRVGAGLNYMRLAPLRKLEKWMVRQMRDIKLSGNIERANAFIEVLREMSAIKNLK